MILDAGFDWWRVNTPARVLALNTPGNDEPTGALAEQKELEGITIVIPSKKKPMAWYWWIPIVLIGLAIAKKVK